MSSLSKIESIVTIIAAEMSSFKTNSEPTTTNKTSSPSISDYLPHDVKIQVLRQAPDVGTMLALMNACPQFMKAFDEAPRTVLTKVVTRQLGVNGFDIRNPLLALQHDLGYPATLEWNNSPAFTAGLKILYGITHGGREVLNLKECFTLLDVGYDGTYIDWLVRRIRDLLDQAAV